MMFLHFLHFMQLQNDKQAPQGELDLKFQLAKETLDTMLKDSCVCLYSLHERVLKYVAN